MIRGMDTHAAQRATETPMLGALEPEKLRDLEHASAEEKKQYVEELIRKTSATAAVSALQPVPVLDVAILTPLQHRLVRSIGLVHGLCLDDEQVRLIFREVRAPVVATQTALVATKLLQWIPWVPEIIAVSLAYAITFAIGQVSDEYFTQSGMSLDELKSRLEGVSKERFAEAVRAKQKEVRALVRNPETRRRVKELRKELHAGTIDEEEETRRLDAILRANPA
jgi:uncharacterized protein (DUF697 family)